MLVINGSQYTCTNMYTKLIDLHTCIYMCAGVVIQPGLFSSLSSDSVQKSIIYLNSANIQKETGLINLGETKSCLILRLL